MNTFETTTPITTVLDITAGRIQLIAADRTETTVEIRPTNPTRNRDVKLAEQTTVDYTDGVLRIQTAARTKNQILGPSGSIEITVRLPAGSDIEAKASAAELRGVGRLGNVTFDGAYSRTEAVKLDEATDVTLNAHAGNVTIGRLTGNAEIATNTGDITVTEAHRGTVKARTQVGNVTVDAAHGASATLDAGTTLGRIHNSLKNTEGAAILTIHATTIQGDISARSL